MKTTIIATALTLIAIGVVPAVAQSGRTDSTAPAKPAGSGASAATPADPKVSPAPKATADDDPKAADRVMGVAAGSNCATMPGQP